MKIGVTGCSGYVGTVLVRLLLEEGHKVVGLDNFHKGHCDSMFNYITHPEFQFLEGSVTDKKDCNRLTNQVDVVINLAAIVGFPACKRQPELATTTNLHGVHNLLEVKKDVPLIQASTDSVYGLIEGKECREDTEANPQSLYGVLKREAELAILNENTNDVILRFATGMGVSPCMRVNLLVNDFVCKAIHERSLVVFEPDVSRAFINVYDMARAFLHFAKLAVDGTAKHSIYNVGDDSLNWTKRQVAEYLKQKTGCVVVYEEIAKDLDCRNYVVNHDKLTEAGFECEISMEQTVSDLIKATPILRTQRNYQ